jgi:transposase
MKEYNSEAAASEAIYMGVDLHRKSWHLTVRSRDQELKKMSLPPQWPALQKVLDHYGAQHTEVVYEAGYFGYRLHDQITAYGARCVVTPPSLLPQQSGNRVKTDKRDSAKLARLLAKGELKAVYGPSVEERNHRQVLRHRHQMMTDRTRVQLRLKAFLMFHGVPCPECNGKWSNRFVQQLHALDWHDCWLQQAFGSLLEQYAFCKGQILQATRNLRELAASPTYQERVRLLRSVPGVGLITAMEVWLELQDMSRFSSGEKLAAYVGLTPTQHSSGDQVRMGHITGVGKGSLRGSLTEAAWTALRKDGVLAEKYQRLKARAGSKRAIVAVAHNLLLRIRRVLLDGVPYAVGVSG